MDANEKAAFSDAAELAGFPWLFGCANVCEPSRVKN
jgi:hypothetical protein